MKRLLSNAGWWGGGAAALALLNVIFFVFVVVMDAALGVAPQFAVPLFVPALVACGLAVSLIAWACRPAARNASDSEPAASAARWRGRWGEPALRSAVIIRRRYSTDNIHARERRAYGATV